MEKTLKIFEETEEIKVVTKRKKIRVSLCEILFYLVFFAVTTLLFLTVKPNNELIRGGAISQMMIIVFTAVIVGVAVLYAVANKLDRKTAIFALFIIGIIIRVGYMLYTPLSTRQHDTFTSSNAGHEAYAWTIYSTGKLPDNNYYQFYHPPLNAFIQATFMKIMDVFTKGLTQVFNLGNYFPEKFLQGYNGAKAPTWLPAGSEYRYFLYSTTQILACFYSVVTCVYMLKLIRLFGFKDSTAVLTSAVVILFPRTIQFSAMVNNDALSLMLSVLALYFALKWQKQGKKPINMILCAFSCGFGMMTKLASATICLPIAGIFIYEFVILVKDFLKAKKSKDGAKIKDYIGLPLQYVGFLLICAPLALWFQFYVQAKFDQGFGFVFNNLNHRLGTTHHSLFERLFIAFDFEEYFGQLYCVPFYGENELGQITYYNHYNLFNYQLRSALFGEFTYDGGEGFALLAYLFGLAFCVILFVALVKCLLVFIDVKRGKSEINKNGEIINFKDFLFVFLLFQSQFLPEIIFYVKMPYACTMDFRYVMPSIIAIALTVGYASKTLKAEGGKFSLALNRLLVFSIIGTLSSVVIFYSVCA